MATAHFSEFSYGFAYTHEVVDTCWAAVAGAPVFPSLYDEGQAGGFDLSIGLLGWTYFAQFKRADFLSRSNASWWHDHGGSYYRFPITRRRHSRQHALLLELEHQSVFHIVEYVAPRFHTAAALSNNFTNQNIVDRSLRIFPRRIGTVDDDQQHYVTYTAAGNPVVRSEPFSIEPPYNAGALIDWSPRTDGAEPVPLDAETFDGISEKLLAIAQEARVPIDSLSGSLNEMSSFGRARTLGRLLAGAELIPIVVAQGDPGR